MGLRTLFRTFNAGEVTPELYGRADLAKLDGALAVCRNFQVLAHGPAVNRPGTEFVRETKVSATRSRLIPFTFSANQTFAIEMGSGYFRFYTNAGILLDGFGAVVEVAHPYAEADLFDVHYVQQNDVITLVHPGYPPATLSRTGATTWAYSTLVFGPATPPPAVVTATATVAVAGSPTINNYAVTALSSSSNQEESLISAAAVAGGPPEVISSSSGATNTAFTTTTAHGLAIGDSVLIQTLSSSGFGLVGRSYDSKVTAVGSSTTFTTTLAIGTVAYNTSGGVPSASVRKVGVSNDLTLAGNYNTVTWTAAVDAAQYNVYKYGNGIWGYVGRSNSQSFIDNNITPDFTKSPPIFDGYLGQGAGNYPAGVSYYEQRKVFGGTINQPNTVWLTRSGTERNVGYSIPTRDDDRINVTIAATEANAIQHIVPLTNLMLLTPGSEFRMASASGGSIKPTDISVKPQSAIGSNNVQPVRVNTVCLYAQAAGGRIREMSYAPVAGGYNAPVYQSNDICVLAPHLFDYKTVVDMCYAKAPVPTLWVIQSDGSMLGMTYLPEQSVAAWHRHDTTNGAFESCCTVRENGEDMLYLIVRRTIGGAIKRYVERLHTRRFTGIANSFFVDCGATYSGAPTTTVLGLAWLEGQTVSILADGAVQSQRVVTGGVVGIDNPAGASTITVGLPITADIQTLPVRAPQDNAQGFGRIKNVGDGWMQVVSTGSMWIGPNFSQLTRVATRTNEIPGSPPALVTDEIRITPMGNNNYRGQFCIRQTDPLPVDLCALTLDVDVGS